MLQAKTALITGYDDQFGAAVAEALCNHGADVYYLKGNHLHQYHASNRAVIIGKLNRPDPAAVVELVHDRLGAVDILINNSSIKSLHLEPPRRSSGWAAMAAANVAAYRTTEALLEAMHKKAWGRVVNTSGLHGMRLTPSKTQFIAARHGAMGLTRTLAKNETAPNVTINALSVPWETFRQQLLDNKQIVARLFELIEYICSDAAALISGQTFHLKDPWEAFHEEAMAS